MMEERVVLQDVDGDISYKGRLGSLIAGHMSKKGFVTNRCLICSFWYYLLECDHDGLDLEGAFLEWLRLETEKAGEEARKAEFEFKRIKEGRVKNSKTGEKER
eukprot:TRINITY_DN2035_c0_g2_i2.p1 TRINITY_DN2035_c0_g2~~TRINITY_DN2035_c0_g2_i2.p1  ORF type:complete len:103 (-),score=26.26 TRINITY_DN2035_c0_g2_i2:102-410(-)